MWVLRRMEERCLNDQENKKVVHEKGVDIRTGRKGKTLQYVLEEDTARRPEYGGQKKRKFQVCEFGWQMGWWRELEGKIKNNFISLLSLSCQSTEDLSEEKEKMGKLYND